MARRPLCIPLDALKQVTYALMELHSLVDCSGAGRALKLCDELRSQLDELIFEEFDELPTQERFDITYTARFLGFTPELSSLDHVLDAFPEILQRLERALPRSQVHKLAQSLWLELGKSSVQKKLRANQERLARPEIFS